MLERQSISSFLTRVKLGTKNSIDDYGKAIESLGNVISNNGKNILDKTPISENKIELNLVIVAVWGLGFKGPALYRAICNRAVKLGLELCPAEVGPALRLQYQDQPRGERILIAMEAITGSDGSSRIFSVARESFRWLGGYCSSPDRSYRLGTRFAFVQVSS